MKSLLIILGILVSCPLFAQYRLLDLEEFSIDSYRTRDRREYFQPEDRGKWQGGARFNFDLRIGEYVQWKNVLHFDKTNSQIRNVGWEYWLLCDYSKYIQPFYYHHSQHATERAKDTFPLENYYGVRFIFYSKGR